MIIAGIDLSYTSPGVCIFNDALPATFENLRFYNLTEDKTKNSIKRTGVYGNIRIDLQKKWLTAEERYFINSQWLNAILAMEKVEEVVLEGYAMGARAGLVFNIAENTSLVKQYMFHNGIKFEVPSPSTVKKQFTGKGNAKKPEMIERFYQFFPHVDLAKQLGVAKADAKPIDDLVDSFANLLTHPSAKEKFKCPNSPQSA